jgi:translation initiation factor 1A
MPPNKKGGKHYKKGKHMDDEPIIYERLSDQMYGRVVKLVGGCNAIIYCNDNIERICHIRGNMRKKVWLSTGDIVLISLRELDRTSSTTISTIQRGDICAKYDPRVIYKLRERDSSINDRLFTLIEKTDNIGQRSCIPATEDNVGFVFETDDTTGENEENEEDEEDKDEDEEEDNEEENKNKGYLPVNRSMQKKSINDDFNIDDI